VVAGGSVVVGGTVVVVDVVVLAADDLVSEASFHGGTGAGAAEGADRGVGALPPGEAEALGPFRRRRRGITSTAPHRRNAATGRPPFPVVVLRAPLSLWDCACTAPSRKTLSDTDPSPKGWSGPAPPNRPSQCVRQPHRCSIQTAVQCKPLFNANRCSMQTAAQCKTTAVVPAAAARG
jgi:hypothetical protein